MKILVIGGNRFFGKKLVELLSQQGHQLWVLNRGNLKTDFPARIEKIICDRSRSSDLAKVVKNLEFDIVYDQVCYEAFEARAAVEIFQNKTKKYIFTSSQSVYGMGSDLKEDLFNPHRYTFAKDANKNTEYGEAKRQCEAIFFAQKKLPVVAVRFPMVFAADDYSDRFQFHLDHLKNGTAMKVPNPKAQLSLISSIDAAMGLSQLAKTKFNGCLNLAANPPPSFQDFIQYLQRRLGKKAVYSNSAERAPYALEENWFMNTEIAASIGIQFDLWESLDKIKL